MREITELVDLPDPTIQPLVHPLDLPEARRPFRISWLLAALTSPAIGLCVAALIWFASGNYVVPVLAGLAVIGLGALASHWFAGQAWAFIPRKRQDHARAVPARWELGSGLVFGLVLGATLLLVADRLNQPDVPTEVRESTVGMSVAIGLMVLGELVVEVLRRHGERRRRVLFRLPGAAAVVASVAVFYGTQQGESGAAMRPTTWWGLVSMLAIGCGIGIWQYRDRIKHT
jgi:hypothetical protein